MRLSLTIYSLMMECILESMKSNKFFYALITVMLKHLIRNKEQAIKMYANSNLLRIGRGRGVTQINLPSNKCICNRPYCLVLCNVCGYWTKGRIRYFCPIHPQTVFLFDITQCPQCKSYGFMLSEF